MVQLRGAAIDQYVERPDPRRPFALLFGPDVGIVTERANALSQILAGGDPAAISRFDEAELASAPGRLSNEVNGGSLFAARKVIRIRAGGPKSISGELKSILESPPDDSFVVVEAGDLRKSSALRRLFETARNAVAIGCYPDTNASLARLIDESIAAANLTISAEAKAALIDGLGADRAASRAEIEKLCLYARDAGVIELADVAALVGDGAAFAIGDLTDAVGLGDLQAVDRSYRQLLRAGTQPAAIGAAAERHFMQLHRLRADIDAGTTVASALQSIRPPPFASRRASLERQLRSWRTDRVARALTRIEQAMIESRLHSGLSDALIGRLLLALAATANRSARAS